MSVASEQVAHAALVGGGTTTLHGHTQTVSFVLEDPVTADSGMLQHKFGRAVTLVRVSASTDTGTCTIQLDERVESTPNTSGVDVLTSPLVADTDSQVTTAFANASIAANAVLNLDIDATSGSPAVLRVHLEYE